MPAPCRLGMDITSVSAWRARVHRTPEIRDVAFSAAERSWAEGVADAAYRYAALWALKEATVKAAGTGFHGVGWLGIEIDVPRRRIRLTELGGRLWIVLTHHADSVVAVVSDVRARIAVGLLPTDGRRRYTMRATQARRAAQFALRQQTVPAGVQIWDRGREERPVLRVGTTEVPVSLSHGDGLVGAAVAGPAWTCGSFLIGPHVHATLPVTAWTATPLGAGECP